MEIGKKMFVSLLSLLCSSMFYDLKWACKHIKQQNTANIKTVNVSGSFLILVSWYIFILLFQEVHPGNFPQCKPLATQIDLTGTIFWRPLQLSCLTVH